MTAIRSDIVDVYVFRRTPTLEFLQLRRAAGSMADTWQPVMGHIEPGETAVVAAARELLEETGLDVRSPECLGWWALEGVHPYFLPTIDAVMLSPRFAAEAPLNWHPTLNQEHTASRWIQLDQVESDFMWPGQAAACREVLSLVLTGKLTRLG